MTGDLTWGTLQFLAGAIAGASTNIQTIFSTFSSIADQSLFLTDLVEFFRVQPTHSLKARRAARAAADSRRLSLRERVVRLSRQPAAGAGPPGPRIAPGERIALIGENGQGKTTIVKLLTRLYDPTEGRILLDGIDLREYSIEDLHQRDRRHLPGLHALRDDGAGQHRGGPHRAREPNGEIENAARKSLADEVIARLPRGYDQLLGRRFEGGLDLSGGEWQKVALARAYLRDAQLLILDEPTAALDARSEYEVFQRFAELTSGKMALLISHRFSTVRMADRIVVLEDGRIAEQGSHDGPDGARGPVRRNVRIAGFELPMMHPDV